MPSGEHLLASRWSTGDSLLIVLTRTPASGAMQPGHPDETSRSSIMAWGRGLPDGAQLRASLANRA
jgi:hypothetical protein